ncbi:unnamed protein product [Rhizophagus irregularis]|nr:unnamed protein product [Rhizophagus irregularis]
MWQVSVTPPSSLGLEVRPRMLSIEKNNNPLRISDVHSANVYMTKISDGSAVYALVVVKVPGFPKAFLKFPSWVKYNEPLSATETYEERYVRSLPNEGDIYVGSPWETGKTYVLEHLTISDDMNLLVLSTRHSYSNAITTRLNLKSYCDIDGNINLPDHKRIVCQIESLHRITNNCKCNKKCKCPPIQYDLWLDEIVSIIA